MICSTVEYTSGRDYINWPTLQIKVYETATKWGVPVDHTLKPIGAGTIKESDSAAIPSLTEMWNNVGQPRYMPSPPATLPNKCNPGTEACWKCGSCKAWSAACVSWFFSGTDFPKSANHNSYFRSGLTNRGIQEAGLFDHRTGVGGDRWWTFSLTHETVKVEIGDVLIKELSLIHI